MKPYLRIIGDVHGKMDTYAKIAQRAQHSIQVGDMGFDYEKLSVNPKQHRFVGGNHDCYDTYYDCPHALGDYGTFLAGKIRVFFIRGGFSVDKKQRQVHEAAFGQKVWWREEELDYKQSVEAFEAYQEAKPDIVVTHTCPTTVARVIGSPYVLKMFNLPEDHTSSTQQLLQECFACHKPRLWFFGHFHRWVSYPNQGTRFICLPELDYIDLNKEGEIYL